MIIKTKNKTIHAALIMPDYEEEVHEKPFTAEEVKNLLARGYTLSIKGVGEVKMDFTPQASIKFSPFLYLVEQLRRLYPMN